MHIQGESVHNLLTHAERRSQLVPIDLPQTTKCWTTPAGLQQELRIIKILENTQGCYAPLIKRAEVLHHVRAYNRLAQHPLTEGQSTAIAHLLTGHDLIKGVQGFAGTGKTTMLKLVNALLTKQGMSICGMAPTATAAKKLEQETGIASQTVARLLQQLQHQPPAANTIYLLDEASMVGSADMEKLMTTMARTSTHLRIVGDRLQLPSIAAGKPFSLLQLYGMATVEMRQIFRQKTDELKNAVAGLIEGDVKKTFQNATWVVESEDRMERLQFMSDTYLSTPRKKRHELLLIVPTHRDRAHVHELIREALPSKENWAMKILSMQRFL